MDKVIKSICIFGGGTSGWLTACHLSHNLPSQVKIKLIESTKIGTIGVGEGTQPFTTAFLYECGLKPEDWMRSCDSTYKLGVELEGWADYPVFVDNDTSDTAVLGNGVFMHDYILGTKKTKQEFVDWIPSYQLARNNKSPKLDDHRLDFTYGLNGQSWDAVHFRADKITETLKNACQHKLEYYDDEVIKVQQDDHGIAGLKTKNNGTLTADLYIDCTGFKSMLLEEALGEPFISFNNTLICDRAVAIPKDYNANRREAMHPYTKAVAMDSGWRWQIPTWSRIGNGYVYSSKHCTPKQAEQQLRDAIGEYEAEANHLHMKIGKHKNIAVKNVYAVGLSAGFVEPLEATGITFTTKAVQNLTRIILQQNGMYDNNSREYLSREFETMIDEIHNFIFIHYNLCHRKDTEFWKDVHKIKLPPSVEKLYRMFSPSPPPALHMKGHFDMFHVGQWFELLFLMGFYDNSNLEITDAVKKYGDLSYNLYKTKTQAQIEAFPNHALYLRDWYND